MEQLLLLLSPFAPHIVEELWERLGLCRQVRQDVLPVRLADV